MHGAFNVRKGPFETTSWEYCGHESGGILGEAGALESFGARPEATR